MKPISKPVKDKEKLPPHVLKSIERGLEQSKRGESISLQEFKEKHFSKK